MSFRRWPDGNCNVIVKEWREDGGTGRKGKVGKLVHKHNEGNYKVQKKKEISEVGGGL